MRISLIETQEIEEHLLGIQQPQNSVIFQTKLMIYPGLADKVKWQEKSLLYIHSYGRKKLKEELLVIEEHLFTKPKYTNFKNQILKFFKH